MLKHRDIVDIVQRRISSSFKTDGIFEVVYEYTDSTQEKVDLFFLLDRQASPKEITNISVKYNHVFIDVNSQYTIKVKPYTSFQRKGVNTTTVWNQKRGFYT